MSNETRDFCAENPDLAALLGISPDDTYESDIEKMAQSELATRRIDNARARESAAQWRQVAASGDFSKCVGASTVEGAMAEAAAFESRVKSEDIDTIRAELMARHPDPGK